MVCSAVSSESLYLRSMDADGKPESVDLTSLFTAGVLTHCGIETEAEEELYVSYALELDDGEAMSLAIAQARNLTLATDERKARRVIRENIPEVRLVSTAEIIHEWAQTREPAEVATVLRSIQVRARFWPQDPDPLAPWWSALIEL